MAKASVRSDDTDDENSDDREFIDDDEGSDESSDFDTAEWEESEDDSRAKQRRKQARRRVDFGKRKRATSPTSASTARGGVNTPVLSDAENTLSAKYERGDYDDSLADDGPATPVLSKGRSSANVIGETKTTKHAPTVSRTITGGDDLPDFLAPVKVFVYNISNTDMIRRFWRLVAAYGGSMDEYMSDKTTHVVSLDDWDHNFDDASKEHANIVFVRPSWIEACHKTQALAPTERHVIRPKK
jgi:hypothetical protein